MLKIDLHIHTIASGHAFSTIQEYINKAKELDMTHIGFTEHGPAEQRSLVNDVYFGMLKRIPRKIGTLSILRGVEANIMSDGQLDITETIDRKLDYVMAGMHPGPKSVTLTKEQVTEAILKAIKSGRLKILTHPYLTSRIDFDVEAVCEEACKNNVLLELNISTFEFKLDDGLVENLKTMLDVARKHGKKIIVNSDAHTIWQLADESPLEKLKGIVDLPKDMIINNYPEELLEFLNIQL